MMCHSEHCGWDGDHKSQSSSIVSIGLSKSLAWSTDTQLLLMVIDHPFKRYAITIILIFALNACLSCAVS